MKDGETTLQIFVGGLLSNVEYRKLHALRKIPYWEAMGLDKWPLVQLTIAECG